MQRVVVRDVPLLHRPSNPQASLYDSVRDVESLRREELRPLLPFVDLVFPPNPLVLLVLDVLEVACRLSHIHLVPDGLQLTLADHQIVQGIGQQATSLPVQVEQVVAESSCLDEHYPEQEP